MKEYNKNNIPLAKNLRKNMTPHERKLWYEFLRTYEMRFQRQKMIGNYIVDFYCAKIGLAIELDGGGHYTEMQIEKNKIISTNIETGENIVTEIDTAPMIYNNRTLVPVRVISESLGYNVGWNGEEKVVTITTY